MKIKNITKLIVAIAIGAIMIVSLCSCNNAPIGGFKFEHVYIETYKTDGQCYTVESWTDSESGIELKTKEIGRVFISEGNYILFAESKDCPYCK